MTRLNPYYNVRPRWTCGSPAMVDQATAHHVAQQEAEAHKSALQGYEGLDRETHAKHPDALLGVAERVVEAIDGFHVEDFCTGERYVRPFFKDSYEANDVLQTKSHGLVSVVTMYDWNRISVKVHRTGESVQIPFAEVIGRLTAKGKVKPLRRTRRA